MPGVNGVCVAAPYAPAVMEMATGDVTHITLALVEAHVGSLIDYLPVALLIADVRASISQRSVSASNGPTSEGSTGMCCNLAAAP
jgi:hypothetical protein